MIARTKLHYPELGEGANVFAKGAGEGDALEHALVEKQSSIK